MALDEAIMTIPGTHRLIESTLEWKKMEDHCKNSGLSFGLIDLGLDVLVAQGANRYAQKAWLIHKIIERDSDLVSNKYQLKDLCPVSCGFAFEFRNLKEKIETLNLSPILVRLSEVDEVNQMVIAYVLSSLVTLHSKNTSQKETRNHHLTLWLYKMKQWDCKHRKKTLAESDKFLDWILKEMKKDLKQDI